MPPSNEFKINETMPPAAPDKKIEEFEPAPKEETSLFTKSGVVVLDSETGDNVVDSEATFVPQKNLSSVRTGSVVIDTSDFDESTMIPQKNASDMEPLDLEKALSLDELDVDDLTYKGVQIVQEGLSSKKINIRDKIPEIVKPDFSLKRKELKVDAVAVAIRRPKKS
jgi:hypothetical protein